MQSGIEYTQYARRMHKQNVRKGKQVERNNEDSWKTPSRFTGDGDDLF